MSVILTLARLDCDEVQRSSRRCPARVLARLIDACAPNSTRCPVFRAHAARVGARAGFPTGGSPEAWLGAASITCSMRRLEIASSPSSAPT
jgi:hypothetical protein